MRILYIGAFRLPNYDAAAPRVLNNAKVFRKAGHDVGFISWGGSYRKEDQDKDGKYRVCGFEYIVTGELDTKGNLVQRIKAKFYRGKKSLALLRNMQEKPELIIMYNADYFWTWKMVRFCRKYGIKLANDMTEWYDNNELHLIDIFPNYINMTCLQHRIHNKIVISRMLKDYYSKSHNLLLPPLCDSTEEKWGRQVEDPRVKPFDGITLIYAGNPAKKDSVHTIINAVDILIRKGKKIRFLLLGITRETYLHKYSKFLYSTDLHENILFLGKVSQDLVPAYYKKADFMVLLREQNRKNNAGFPTKFVESMTAGIPVICNGTSDLVSYVYNGKTGFLVKDCSMADVMEVLQEKVLVLSNEEKKHMKACTKEFSIVFSCQYGEYINEVNTFLGNLV